MDKPMHQYFQDLLQLGNALAASIVEGESDKTNYFCSAVFIESMLDQYGRGMIRRSLREEGADEERIAAVMLKVNKDLEHLRKRIRQAVQTYDFDDVLKKTSEELYQSWQKRTN